jgi:hypothetical protein
MTDPKSASHGEGVPPRPPNSFDDALTHIGLLALVGNNTPSTMSKALSEIARYCAEQRRAMDVQRIDPPPHGGGGVPGPQPITPERKTLPLESLVELWDGISAVHEAAANDGISEAFNRGQAVQARLCAEELQRSLAAVVPVPSPHWQPIETAPKKDGRSVMGGWTIPPVVEEIHWFERGQRWRWTDEEEGDRQPTHWMPLPAPPVAGGAVLPPETQK